MGTVEVEVDVETGGVADVIDAYVSNVALRLRGSARLRADMLTEIRDALMDAAEAHEAHGAGDGEAQRRAVAEFGPARRIAADLQDELAHWRTDVVQHGSCWWC